MIAKLNNDVGFHGRKWSGVGRSDVGSSVNGRSEGVRAGGLGGVGWGVNPPDENQLLGLPVSCPWADRLGLPSINAEM